MRDGSRTLILHIGGEKTGSKSIQRWLSRHARRDMRRRGMLYPTRSALFLRNAHYPIVSPFLAAAELDFVEARHRLTRQDLHAELARLGRRRDAGTVILSAEHLSSRLRRPEIEMLGDILRAAMPAYRVRIVYHVRSQGTLYCAGRSTYLKTFGIRHKQPGEVTSADRFFNHLTIARDWAGVFGRSNVVIRNFHDGDAVSMFMQTVGTGAAAEEDDRRPKRNVSLSCEEALIVAALNEMFGQADFGRETLIRIRRRVQRMLILHLRAVLPVHTPFVSILRPAEWEHFRDEFSKSNDRLQSEFELAFNLNDHQFDDRPAGESPAGAASIATGAVTRELERWRAVVGEPPRTPEEAEAAARRLHGALVKTLLRRHLFGVLTP